MLSTHQRLIGLGILSALVICATLMGCEKPLSNAETCAKELGCLNEQLISLLASICQEGKPCNFSFKDIASEAKADRVYFSNQFGAHPSLGACKGLPMSKGFSESTRFGCEYAVLASQGKFRGYVRGACDASLVPLPSSDKIVFAKGFDAAGISIEADQKLSVERRRIKESAEKGAVREVDYYYLELDNKKATILQEGCFHF